jgi:signal transduction histidine kinase
MASSLRPRSAPRAGVVRQSLYAQIRWARIWLPLLIVAVVVVHQLAVVPLGGPVWRFWSQLLFYALLGPTVTFVTLAWIAGEVRERERAQVELQRTFRELEDSYAVLGALQRVTEQFASAVDLEQGVRAAARGVRDVTGARAAAVVVGPGIVARDSDDESGPWAPEALVVDALARDALLRERGLGEDQVTINGSEILSLAVRWRGRHEGSVHAVFDQAPDENQRETLRILTSDFAAVAEAVQHRTRDLITLFEVDRSIRAEENLDRLLGTLVSTLAVRVEATSAGVYLSDEDDMLELRAAVRLERGDGDIVPIPLRTPSPPLAADEGPIGRAIRRNEPLLLPELRAEEREAGGPLLARAGSAVLLPLTAESTRLGVIVLAHAASEHFTPASLPFLEVVASQVSLAVANANAYRQSEELAITEERARIAREVHDGVAQSLAFSALKLDLVAKLLERDPATAARELSEATATVREMIKEIRRAIFALRPVDLERYGFLETLRRYTVDFGQQNGLTIELDLEPLPQLSMKSEAVLFRIFQEAMHNVAKHAGASRVSVRVGGDSDGRVQVEVCDDGRGFDLAAVGDRVTSAGGLGLRQMHERVEARGGTLDVESRPGAGTRVRATVPA